jgi:hypothetical protein
MAARWIRKRGPRRPEIVNKPDPTFPNSCRNASNTDREWVANGAPYTSEMARSAIAKLVANATAEDELASYGGSGAGPYAKVLAEENAVERV